MFTGPYIDDVDEALMAGLDHVVRHHINAALVTRNERIASVSYGTSDARRELPDQFVRENPS
ncbi:MAG: hypothetical protein ACI915_002009 [Gammaproteobacteria bacterium]|jgi:hypothetical protein